MPLAIIRVTTTDYDVWHEVHVNAVRRYREDLSLIANSIYRDLDDPRTVMLFFEIESVEKFQTFAASETFAGLVAQGKLEGEPTMWFQDKVEEVDLDG